MDYEKCSCAHCGQNIEYPAEGTGRTVPCPTCEKPVTLTPTSLPAIAALIVIPQTPVTTALVPSKEPNEQKRAKTNLSKLTEETIRSKTKRGDTPLHRAAKLGLIYAIPKHLLKTELFMARNDSFSRETPLHIAARYGHLNQVPSEFLTKETLTASTEYEKKESRTGPTPPRTETPLHTAARCGHADQIPKEFLIPEFLSIEASGYRNTVLHDLAYSGNLDLIPNIYANSEMWNLRNSQGQTPRDVVEAKIQREDYVGRVRVEPATEKQKEKLRYFGCTWPGGITKGQAHDAIDECVRLFPKREFEYCNRPATEEQLAELTPILKALDEEPEDYADSDRQLTYGQAKQLLEDIRLEKKQKEEEKMVREVERHVRARERKEKGNKAWFDKWDRPPVVEAKAKARLALNGLQNVRVIVASAYGKIVINLDADTDDELARAAKVLGISKSDCI